MEDAIGGDECVVDNRGPENIKITFKREWGEDGSVKKEVDGVYNSGGSLLEERMIFTFSA